MQRLALRILAVTALALLACGRAEPPVSSSPIAAVAADEIEALVASADGPLLLDVRSSEEFASGHVPGARNIPHDELADRLDEIGEYRERGVVAYCERGGRAGMALGVLEEAGFSDLGHLEGDMSGWRSAGREVAPSAD